MSAFFTCLNVFALDSLSTQVLDSSKKFDKWQFTGPLPRHSDSLAVGWEWGICILKCTSGNSGAG